MASSEKRSPKLIAQKAVADLEEKYAAVRAKPRSELPDYLAAAYGWKKRIMKCDWKAVRRELKRLCAHPLRKNSIINLLLATTSDRDSRTRAKWRCAIEYGAKLKWTPENFASSLKGAGGINACAYPGSASRQESARRRKKKPRRASDDEWE